ncbi:MAG TPA: peroxide stress protein YaaA [Candidatus Mediterraneibacter stercoravium]|uniref:UPF0246 protein H9723_05045 n=1 Tax=Candidatus Mediterraneibacter stercoravium TaxID=2838685 RepID=A0A9D2G7M1_9FIRM|nr:peroxide stress protein YaaA [Candidatus Mediterraneibacter stercoravium]
MKIIISPAKKMNVDTDTLAPSGLPVFLEETEQLMEWMRRLSLAEAKALWKCNDRIAEQNYRRFQEMDLRRNLTPAVIAYEGIQYQYMAPAVFGGAETEYIREHLRILSGFYGVLKPFDGVVPYRLEMQAKASEAGDLYRFWGEKLYREAADEVILNLASKEYSRCIEKYLRPENLFLTVTFGELIGGKVKQKGTFAKMARGEMVRYLAENQVEEPQGIKGFDRLDYHFAEELSTETEYVFLKQ